MNSIFLICKNNLVYKHTKLLNYNNEKLLILEAEKNYEPSKL